MKKLIAGNWKMNGSNAMCADLILEVSQELSDNIDVIKSCDLLICPPFPYIHKAIDHLGIDVGAQDCSVHESGAYTGEVSAQMLSDIGCKYVILGHSERREYHNESDALIREKATMAHQAGLIAIICVGETEEQRKQGIEKEIVKHQLEGALPGNSTASNTVIAYEPVWAIGTGQTATPEDASVMHGFIRSYLSEKLDEAQKTRILYGGSMKPDNAKQLLSMPDIDGGLIGGASLNAEQFLAIALAATGN